jgi:hypothetical protein
MAHGKGIGGTLWLHQCAKLSESPDAQWYRIVNSRSVDGWVHVTLLMLDPVVEEQVEVER